MKKDTQIGRNRTGTGASPIEAGKTAEGAKASPPTAPGSKAEIAALRKLYIRDTGPVGSVPLPGTLKGLAKTAFQKFSGRQPEVLVDQLGARLSFERTGVRLYDALIVKCEEVGGMDAPDFSIEQLRGFRREELEHFLLVSEAMTKLGADPTAMTPGANVGGVMAQGILQVLTDPRTSVPQCLSAMLVAELADNDGWDMLIELTEGFAMNDVAREFRRAKEAEDLHLEYVRSWLATLLMPREAQAA